MKIDNKHERSFNVPADSVGDILNTLSSANDKLWPHDKWPPMRLDANLKQGAKGGHGPVRYYVDEYTFSRRAIFRFDGTGLTAGLDGRHYFEIIPRHNHNVLRHVVDAECDLRAWLKWKLLVEPIHDALLEDALDRAEQSLEGKISRPAHWSPWVRFVRRIMDRKLRRTEKTN
jgi:hypothetical protein